MLENQEWITTAEAAGISGYHPEHVRWLIRQGRIRAIKFGIVWQIYRNSLLTYIEESAHSEDGRRGPKSGKV